MRLRKKLPSTGRQRLRSPVNEKPAQFGYYSRRDEESLKTGRQMQREQIKTARSVRLRSWTRSLGLIVLLFAVIVSVANVLSLSPKAKVLPLNSGGESSFLHDQKDYEAAANEVLSGSPWNRNKVTIDTSKVESELKRQFPELTSVSVTLPLVARRPVIYLETARPAIVVITNDGTYLLNSNGRALLSGADVEAPAYKNLPRVTDQSGLEVKLNKQVLSSQEVAFIRTVSAQLNAKQVGVASLTLPPAASELHVQLANKPYFVKFNIHAGTARQQTGTLLATLNYLNKQGVTPSKYIDVRVDGRAYYQ